MCLKREFIGGWKIGEDILLSNSWLSFRDQPRLQLPLSEELSTAHVVDLIGQPTK